MFLANPRSFGRMTEEQRGIVIEEGTKAGQAARKGVRDKEEWYLAEMQRAGVAITRPEVIAASSPFAWVLIQQEIPNSVIAALFELSSEPWVILLIVNAILLVLGMFIEGVAIIIIAFPVLLRVMLKIGVDPVHFGVIMVLNIMIGLVTPPVGLCLYMVSEVSKVPIGDIVAEMWPYVLALIGVLMVVTYVPALSLWLPQTLGYGLVR